MLRKILLGLLLLVIILVAGAFTFIQLSYNKTYDLPYPELQVSTDSAVLARGEYLVNGPAHCVSCHVGSVKEAIRSDQGEKLPLRGGLTFAFGPLGTISTANLTPDPETGIGRYSDGEVFRMMRHAVKPNGTATLTPMMPFWNMADEDLVAIVSYLRSLEPVNNPVPDPQWTFMGKFVRTISSAFKPVTDPTPPKTAPTMAPTVERGEYLANYVANCVGCHTPRDLETFEPIGPEFSGGMEFEPWPEFYREVGVDEDLWVRSTNLTPDPGSALARFKTPEEWVARFRQGRILMHSPMDWGPFSRMTDEDLTAIWMYLNSLEPVQNDITEVNFKKTAEE